MGEICSRRLQLQETEILEVTEERADGVSRGIGTAGFLPRRMTAEECCAQVKRAFGLGQVRIFGDPCKEVFRAALCPGSGKSLLPRVFEKQADVYITGDIGHHDGIDAADQGLCIIDAGHYGLEHVFVEDMESYLRETFPELEVKAERGDWPFAFA